MNEFLHSLKQPEYVHVLLNPLPVYGTAMGVLALVLGILLRSCGAQGVALLLILVACLSVWPVAEFGDEAADRVQSIANQEGTQWLHAHEERADDFEWVFYVTAALAAAGIVAVWKFPRISRWLTLLALVGALGSLAAGGWISRAGGQIRHSEFRQGPPPVVEESHEHGQGG